LESLDTAKTSPLGHSFGDVCSLSGCSRIALQHLANA
jgi:hypothetical protein